MTCRCHNKTWSEDLRCDLSFLLCQSASILLILVQVWMTLTLCGSGFNQVCVFARVHWKFVCKSDGILRDCLSHIWGVSSLVFCGLDLRARHLLILKNNCSWEPDCTRIHTCLCLCVKHISFYIFVSTYEHRKTLDWPKSTQGVHPVWPGPVQWKERKGLKPSLEQGLHIFTPGRDPLNIKAFRSSLKG